MIPMLHDGHMMVMFEHSFTFHLHSYENARFKVDTIFGQRFIPGFPQTLVPCGQAIGCGSYPSTSGGLYRAGIDLSVPAGTKVTLNIIAAGGVEGRERMERVGRRGGGEIEDGECGEEGWRKIEDGECGRRGGGEREDGECGGGVEERGRMEGVERGGGREMMESVGEGWREGEDGECGEGWRGAR